jgi:hypothetical protein
MVRGLGRGVDNQIEWPLMIEWLGRQWHEFVEESSSTSQREMISPPQSGSRRGNGEGNKKVVVVELLL